MTDLRKAAELALESMLAVLCDPEGVPCFYGSDDDRKEIENSITTLREALAQPKGQQSDGYHTFDELYDHRCHLFVALMQSNKHISWTADKHADGEMYASWFIAGMDLPTGRITYHLPLWMKDLCHGITHQEFAPEWDGHTAADVVSRLAKWCAIARPGQEPVAWAMAKNGTVRFTEDPGARNELMSLGWGSEPLYAHPSPVPKGWQLVPKEPDDDDDLEAIVGEANRIAPVLRKKGHYLAANITELLVAHITNPAPIPEGWQLVPIEPTEEMVDKGAQGMASFQEDSVWPNSWDAIQVKGMRHDAKKAYRYMLAAAPKPE